MYSKLFCLLFGMSNIIINGVYGGMSSCKYSESYDFTLKRSTQITSSNKVGRINIGDSFILSFTLTVNELHGNEWVSILHIGESDSERSPGIWLWPSTAKLHIALSDIDNWNTYNDIDEELEIGTSYRIKLTVSSDGEIKGYLDNDLKFSYNDTVILTRFRSPIFIGDPWYTPVNGTVKNLIIESYDDDCSVSSGVFGGHDKSLDEYEIIKSFNNNNNENSFVVGNYGDKWLLSFEPYQLIIIGIFTLIGVVAGVKWIVSLYKQRKDDDGAEYSKLPGSV